MKLLEQNKVEFTKVNEGTEEIIIVTCKTPPVEQNTPPSTAQDSQERQTGGYGVITKTTEAGLQNSTIEDHPSQARTYTSLSVTSKGTSVASIAKRDMEPFFSDQFEAEDIESDELNSAIDHERQLVTH